MALGSSLAILKFVVSFLLLFANGWSSFGDGFVFNPVLFQDWEHVAKFGLKKTGFP